jgi:hypothetical protein
MPRMRTLRVYGIAFTCAPVDKVEFSPAEVKEIDHCERERDQHRGGVPRTLS